MEAYEQSTKTYLPPRTYTFIRVDGKSFKNFTKKFKRPFDDNFVNLMNQAAISLCETAQGAKIAFVQSDEITVILTDFDDINTGRWYDGEGQKVSSISASIATESFNRNFYKLLVEQYASEKNTDSITIKDVLNLLKTKGAEFDGRAFSIPSPTDVINNLVWRQGDATRNSISSAARALFSQSQLLNKNGSEKQEMMFQKGVNWNDYPVGVKRGRVIMRNEDGKWVVVDPPIFTQNWDWLTNIIPNYK